MPILPDPSRFNYRDSFDVFGNRISLAELPSAIDTLGEACEIWSNSEIRRSTVTEGLSLLGFDAPNKSPSGTMDLTKVLLGFGAFGQGLAGRSGSRSYTPRAPRGSSSVPFDDEGIAEYDGNYQSGYKGVSWNRRMQSWLAFWAEGNRRHSKSFAAKAFGFENARKRAIDFLRKKRNSLGLAEDDNVYATL